MSNLLDSSYFIGDIQRVRLYCYVILTYIIVIALSYITFLFIAEIVYFIKCKICNEVFDYKVVTRIFTDFNDEE